MSIWTCIDLYMYVHVVCMYIIRTSPQPPYTQPINTLLNLIISRHTRQCSVCVSPYCCLPVTDMASCIHILQCRRGERCLHAAPVTGFLTQAPTCLSEGFVTWAQFNGYSASLGWMGRHLLLRVG